MKYKVTLWVSGKTFTESVEARNPQEAKITMQTHNPFAKIISVNASFL